MSYRHITLAFTLVLAQVCIAVCPLSFPTSVTTHNRIHIQKVYVTETFKTLFINCCRIRSTNTDIVQVTLYCASTTWPYYTHPKVLDSVGMGMEGSQFSELSSGSQVQVEVHMSGNSSSSRAGNEALCLEILGTYTSRCTHLIPFLCVINIVTHSVKIV